MKIRMDYEKKVCGLRDKSWLEKFIPGGLKTWPKEFNRLSGKILDIGCGAGAFTGKLKNKRPELEVYGVDISKKAIEIAKKDSPEVNFSAQNTYKLTFADNFFEAVVMYQVLEHLQNPAQALMETKRVLKPGGLFFLSVPLEGDRLILSPPRRLCEKYQGHFQRFSRAEIFSLLAKAGFRVKRFYFSGFLFCQLLNLGCLFLFQLLGLPREFSVQGYLYQEKRSRVKPWLSVLRKIVFGLEKLESFIVPNRVPGYCFYIIADNEIS